MLQVNVKTYASDALEDAMKLAQTKALNSYTFSDCLSYLNYAWADIYARMAAIDSGYYSQVVRLTRKLTKLPPYVKSTVHVFAAQSPLGYNRQIYREAGQADLNNSLVYKISGTDLYCADAERRTVWLEYVPQPKQVFFTHINRDPILHDEAPDVVYNTAYKMKALGGYINDVQFDTFDSDTIKRVTKWVLYSRATYDKNTHTWIAEDEKDITPEMFAINKELPEAEQYELVFVTCDYPYIFCTYKNKVTDEYASGFFDSNMNWNAYNPFEFTGRGSNVEYLQCKWNDKTGMGVIIKDHNDLKNVDGELVPIIKELGWTPDTLLNYPCPEMYRYLVARLADKFSALNESNVMGVQMELAEARYAFESLLRKDKSAFYRINNVNTPTIGDML